MLQQRITKSSGGSTLLRSKVPFQARRKLINAPKVHRKRVSDLGSDELEGDLVLCCPSQRRPNLYGACFFEWKSHEWLISLSKYAGARPWRPLNTSMYFRQSRRYWSVGQPNVRDICDRETACVVFNNTSGTLLQLI